MDTVNPLPAEFQASYDERDRYPQNLLRRSISTYPIALSRYLERLDKAADDLCEKDVEKVDVCFRDLKTNDGAGEGLTLPSLDCLLDGAYKLTELANVSKRNIHSPTTLTQWLGVRQIGRGSSNQLLGVAEKDPKCRFMCVTNLHFIFIFLLGRINNQTATSTDAIRARVSISLGQCCRKFSPFIR